MADNGVRTLNALIRVPVDQLDPGPNARGQLGDLTNLAVSLQALGQQHPLLVSQQPDGRYQILDGHRRHAAAQQLGLTHLDAVLRRDHGPVRRLQQQLAIHLQAAAFDPIAEAQALQALMWEHQLDRDEIARAIGKSPQWVRDRILLLQLEPDEREALQAGRMPVGVAIATARGRLSVRARGDGDDRPGPGSSSRPPRTRTGRAPARAAGRRVPEPAGAAGSHCPTCSCTAVVTDG